MESKLERGARLASEAVTDAERSQAQALATHTEAVKRRKAARANVKRARLAESAAEAAAAKAKTGDLEGTLRALARWADPLGHSVWGGKRRGELGPDGLQSALSAHVASISDAVNVWKHSLAAEARGRAETAATDAGEEVKEAAAVLAEADERLRVAKQDHADATAMVGVVRPPKKG